MTTTEIPMTEHGSSRMTMTTEMPWWIVRAPLALVLAISISLAIVAWRLTGTPHPGWTLSARSFAPLLTALSATPALAAIGLAACVLMIRRGRRPLQMLCGVLAFAALTGAGLNVAREGTGRGALEVWIEKAILDAPEAPTVRAL